MECVATDVRRHPDGNRAAAGGACARMSRGALGVASDQSEACLRTRKPVLFISKDPSNDHSERFLLAAKAIYRCPS
jgi:hypothetical protein